jgi:competence protein ComEA
MEDYLKFSKKNRIGFLIVLISILLLYIFPFLPTKTKAITIKTDEALLAAITTAKTKQARQKEEENDITYQYEPSQKKEFIKGILFEFDPNSLSEKGWRKLGLNERTIKTIIKYRNKGGKFYKKEDLQKIWGLPAGFYDHVKNYIAIQNLNAPAKNYTATVNSKPAKTWNIEVNSADTSALVELPGIGSKLALRIINFRNKLGGFYSVEQVGETYGLPDSTFKKIKPFLHINGEVRKININTATKEELKLHPYIKWNLATMLVEYRNQHGYYKSMDDLKNIAAIDETTLLKLSPYLYCKQ